VAQVSRTKPTKQASLADGVTEQIRHAILTHEFHPGDRLAAEALAERFSVSATPVREAFARLAGEGLVTQLPQRGVRVSEISVVDMEEIYELRLLLEPIAIRRSVAARTDAWAGRLEHLFERMREAGGADLSALDAAEYTAYEEIHVEFHRETMSRCDSRWVRRFTDTLLDHSRRFRQFSLAFRDDHAEILEEHAGILHTCVESDPDAAADRHRQHLERTREAIRRWADT
jgi:GntR family carbon starvation induced transcriptional regulator